MSTADALAGEKKLFDELFVNYSKEVRPKLNSSEAVIVSVELALRQLKSLVGNIRSLHFISLPIAQHGTDYKITSVCLPDRYYGQTL